MRGNGEHRARERREGARAIRCDLLQNANY
jgi:hypothetical protein